MLRAPGPTTCPPEVLSAMARQMIGLNNAELSRVMNSAAESIRNLLFSPFADLNVCLLSASGTGAMEAAVCNFLSPTDRVLVCSCGVFGERFAEIASAFGLKTQMLSRPYGYAFNPDGFETELKRNCKIFGEPKAVFITHNETSTGVTNPVEQLANIVCKNSKASLIIVDATSSFAIAPLKMRDWKIDVVLGGVQKGLMTPPGLSFVAFNENAMQAYQSSTMPRYYFDLGKYVKTLKSGQTPFTPAISQLRALKTAIDLICKEGTRVYDRHSWAARYTRQLVGTLGLELFAKECFSDGVTAVKVPDDLKANANDIIRLMLEDYGIEIAGGPGELAGKIIRIGHMGYFTSEDISNTFYALERTLIKLRKIEKSL